MIVFVKLLGFGPVMKQPAGLALTGFWHGLPTTDGRSGAVARASQDCTAARGPPDGRNETLDNRNQS